MSDRRFARLRRGPISEFPGSVELPDSGLCLSTFLVLESPKDPGSVLMGQIDPTANWWEIGALDPKRISTIGDLWMLPSCQLLFFETPEIAAQRILREQLGGSGVVLDGPRAFSDPAEKPSGTAQDPHWDFHFVFRGRWPHEHPPKFPAWRRLEFVNVGRTRRVEIARHQADVLELVGLPPAD
jgi:hypothetical protein